MTALVILVNIILLHKQKLFRLQIFRFGSKEVQSTSDSPVDEASCRQVDNSIFTPNILWDEATGMSAKINKKIPFNYSFSWKYR